MVAWLLANTSARPVDLWTITLKSGAVYRFSGTDAAVTFDGMTFELGPAFEASGWAQSFGVSVDTLSVKMLARDTDMLAGESWHAAAARGVLDGATLALWSMFQDHAGNVRGVVADWLGNIGQIESDRSRINMKVRSWTELLDVSIPGAVYQQGCRNTLYQGRCTVNRDAFTVYGSLNAASYEDRRSHSTATAAVVTKPAGWANLGEMQFTTGPNAGVSRPVRAFVTNAPMATISAMYPFPFSASAGDQFLLRAGCDKTRAQCQGKFNNLANFRGEPFIPPPETAL